MEVEGLISRFWRSRCSSWFSVIAESLGEHFFVVLTQERSGGEVHGRVRHLDRAAGQGERAVLGVIDGHYHLALPQVLVCVQIDGVEARAG